MIFEKIPFATVIKFVEKIFDNNTGIEGLRLTPESIHQFAASSGIQLKWRPILNWENCFDYNTYEYTEQDFLDIAFAKTQPSGGQTIVITDECFKDCMAFSIANFKNMIRFMEVEYPSLFGMQFPQPSDFIFIQPGIDLITMIHHDGARTMYYRS